MKALRTLFGNLDHFRIRFLLIFLVGIADGAATFYIPLLLSRYTRGGVPAADYRRLTLLLAGLFGASLLLQWVLRRYGEMLGPQIGFHLRKKYLRAVEQLPSAQLAEHHSGYLLSLVGAVADSLGGLTTEIFWGLAKSLATVVLFFYAALAESWAVALFNAVMLALFLMVTSKLARRMVPLTNSAAMQRAALFERYADFMSNIMTVKKLGLAGFAGAEVAAATAAAEQAVAAVQRFHALRWFVLHFLIGTAYIVTIAAALRAMADDRNFVSSLILIVGAYAIVRTLVERLSENYRQLIEVGGYVDSLDSIVRLENVNSVTEPLPAWQRLEFSSVKFSYAGLKQTLEFDSFKLERGERIFICGPSGAGKTTLLNLLANFLHSSAGRRTIDGSDYSVFSDGVFRRMFLLLSQEAELFNLSIRANLLLGRQLSDAVLFDHLQRLGLKEWVEGHGAGLSSLVGEKGLKVSAGQKQRLNLIRGILIDRTICLLDEPTAHLDQDSEELVAKYLEQELKGRTAVIVSHRARLRSLCSRCYRIENGRISEEEAGPGATNDHTGN